MTVRRALLIDDDAEIREVVKVSLELMGGWQVTTAGSGPEGLAQAAALQPDVILLDVLMPEMDGPTTLQALQAAPATRAIPVILLSALAPGAETERYASLGAAGLIAKPFNVTTLASQVATILGWDR